MIKSLGILSLGVSVGFGAAVYLGKTQKQSVRLDAVTLKLNSEQNQN